MKKNSLISPWNKMVAFTLLPFALQIFCVPAQADTNTEIKLAQAAAESTEASPAAANAQDKAKATKRRLKSIKRKEPSDCKRGVSVLGDCM